MIPHKSRRSNKRQQRKRNGKCDRLDIATQFLSLSRQDRIVQRKVKGANDKKHDRCKFHEQAVVIKNILAHWRKTARTPWAI